LDPSEEKPPGCSSWPAEEVAYAETRYEEVSVAGAEGPEAGAAITCPNCGQEVMKKAMIPIRSTDGAVLLCVNCARAHIVKQAG
jgi:predicted RNA-binding Zn-ribbon protein involved in translation (DUF1610 family)